MATDEPGVGVEKKVKKRRFYRRADKPTGLFPWGLLPLIGLVGVYAWGVLRTAPHIQQDVQDEVTRAMRLAGMGVERITADGQNVALTVNNARADEVFVRALAESARCSTWRGDLDCPLNVELTMTRASVEPGYPDRFEAPDSTPTPAAIEARHHDFTFNVSGRALRLTGEVGSVEERARILNAARARFGEIDSQLRVTGEPATDQEPLAADRALQVVSHFTQGEAVWRDGSLSAIGRVLSSDDLQMARDVFNDSENRPTLGGITVQVDEVVARCNRSLAETLNDSTIAFRTGSAQIDAGNDELLQLLASMIDGCPGTLTIEGHTDDVGEEQNNLVLSQARADAVREALMALGVDEARLKTRGYGESRPVADNSTRTGRAQNRRIVIAIDDL
ncbi:MAG: OmpA family protein [Pseudomonadota bacterium]